MMAGFRRHSMIFWFVGKVDGLFPGIVWHTDLRIPSFPSEFQGIRNTGSSCPSIYITIGQTLMRR